MSDAVMELPRISIKTEVKRAEAKPFVGRVTSDLLQPGRFDPDKHPYQWVLAVEPMRNAAGTEGYKLGGKTGCWWEYVNIKVEELEGKLEGNTKFKKHFEAFQKVFGKDDDRAIGRGEYVDEVAWFIHEEQTYGTNKQTDEPIKSTVTLPVRRLTPEEMVAYGLAASSSLAVDAASFSAEDLQALAEVLDGVERSSMQKAVYKSKLDGRLKSAVGKGNGPAIDALIEGKYGVFDGDTFEAIRVAQAA